MTVRSTKEFEDIRKLIDERMDEQIDVLNNTVALLHQAGARVTLRVQTDPSGRPFVEAEVWAPLKAVR